MKYKKLFWQIFPFTVGFSLVATIIVFFIVGLNFRETVYEHSRRNLVAYSELLAGIILAEVAEEGKLDKARATNLILKTRRAAPTRVTIARPNGEILADSAKVDKIFKNIKERPEIFEARQKGFSYARRYSYAMEENYMYVAQALYNGTAKKNLIGYLRVGLPLTNIQSSIFTNYKNLLVTGLTIIAFIALSIWIIAKKITIPLRIIKTQANKIAVGDFSKRIEVAPSQSLEVAELASSMNEITVQLDSRIKTILEQKNEQEAVFSSMVEGIIAVDERSFIKTINEPAAKILNIPSERLRALEHATVEEVIRVSRVQEVIKETLETKEPIERELTIFSGASDRILQVHASPLRNAKGKRTGSVLVFNDITRLKQLENMRREFVANVSHELRTPLTTIQGFIETIQSSQVSESDQKEFIRIIGQNALRLGKIIEDLLALSSIEKVSEKNEIELTKLRLRPVLSSAIELCRPKAKHKNIMMELECAPDIEANLNPTLLEQAIVNLLDNAIKYSEVDKKISIRVEKSLGGAVIEVADQGFGIAPEHLPRLFERFYRVDKARSRNMGGTGLGLSIVKHIAKAHSGNIEVESTIGEGTTFRLRIGQKGYSAESASTG